LQIIENNKEIVSEVIIKSQDQKRTHKSFVKLPYTNKNKGSGREGDLHKVTLRKKNMIEKQQGENRKAQGGMKKARWEGCCMWLVVVQEWGNEIRASQRAKLSIA
jgi:hypothetical protein